MLAGFPTERFELFSPFVVNHPHGRQQAMDGAQPEMNAQQQLLVLAVA
jgi:hypothetical protein